MGGWVAGGVLAHIGVVAGQPGEADEGPHSKGAVHGHQAPQGFVVQEAAPGHIPQRVYTLLTLAAHLYVAAACTHAHLEAPHVKPCNLWHTAML